MLERQAADGVHDLGAALPGRGEQPFAGDADDLFGVGESDSAGGGECLQCSGLDAPAAAASSVAVGGTSVQGSAVMRAGRPGWLAFTIIRQRDFSVEQTSLAAVWVCIASTVGNSRTVRGRNPGLAIALRRATRCNLQTDQRQELGAAVRAGLRQAREQIEKLVSGGDRAHRYSDQSPAGMPGTPILLSIKKNYEAPNFARPTLLSRTNAVAYVPVGWRHCAAQHTA